MNNLIKIALSLLIALCAIYPYVYLGENSGVLNTLNSANIVGLLLLITGFFIAVGFYCKSLQTCLQLIQFDNRKANPKSVWYMFLIPFNIIEDFFIIINVSNSIEKEAQFNPQLSTIKDFGFVSGIGWCIAQVISFVPNYIGQIAGFIGFILWIIHWSFILKVNKLLIK
jgi:hypothetical protein